MSWGFMLGSGVGVAGRTGSRRGLSGDGETGGCAGGDAKIVSRLRTAAFTDASRPFFTRADKYSSKTRSDRRTSEDESYSQFRTFVCSRVWLDMTYEFRQPFPS